MAPKVMPPPLTFIFFKFFIISSHASPPKFSPKMEIRGGHDSVFYGN